MTDLHDRLVARQRDLPPEPGGFERLSRRRRRREIGRRLAAASVAGGISLGVGWLLLSLLPGTAGRPAITPQTIGSMRQVWSAELAGTPSAPTIADGIVFVSADRLYAFPVECEASASCAPLWRGDIGAATTTPPVVDDGIVVAASPTGLTAFSAGCSPDGGVCPPLWRAPSPPPAVPEGGVEVDENVAIGFSEPAITDGEVIVSGPGGLSVYRLDCRDDGGTCSPKWEAGGAAGAGAPAIGPDAIYVHSHREIQAFPRKCPTSSCEPLWTTAVPASDSQSMSLARDTLYVDGVGYRWNGRRLVEVWRSSVARASKRLAPALVHGGVVYLVDDRVFAYPVRCPEVTRSCRPTWIGPRRFDPTLDDLQWSEPVVFGKLVFSGGDAPAAFLEGCAVDGLTCEPVWTGPTAVGTSRPAVSSSILVVTSSQGRVMAYAPAPDAAVP